MGSRVRTVRWIGPRRVLGAAAALALALAPPARADDRVVVLGPWEADAPLMNALRIELRALALEPVAGPPLLAPAGDARSAEARRWASESGAIGALWLEHGPDAPTTIRAALVGGAAVAAPLNGADIAVDWRLIAVVAASLLEEALYSGAPAALEPEMGVLVQAHEEPRRGAPRERRTHGARSSVRMPGVRAYAQIGPGAVLRVYRVPVSGLLHRVAAGVAFGQFRLGAAALLCQLFETLELDAARERWMRSNAATGWSTFAAGGLEVAARISADVLVPYIGAHALIGGHEVLRPREGGGGVSPHFALTVEFGASLALGLAVRDDIDFVLRLEGDLVVAEGDTVRPQLSGVLGVDWH